MSHRVTDYRTHPEYRALLAAVCAAPGDDLPRLVLADWLEEHGKEERSEFIRVQCELAHFGEDDLKEQKPHWIPVCEPGYRRWERAQALRRRERGLLEKYHREFFPPPRGFFPTTMTVSGPQDGSLCWISSNESGVLINFTVRRGFVAEVRCRLADWIGGECERCGGGGTIERRTYAFEPEGRAVGWDDCEPCEGTGRTPGIGPRLVREHPVERVVVARAFAHYHFDSVANEWTFEPWPTIGRLGAIPQFIFDHIHGWKRRTPIQGWKVFDSEVSALDALSAALIAWAKSQEVSYE